MRDLPASSKLLSCDISDLLLLFIFLPFSKELPPLRIHSALNHNEILNPSDICGQQFCPTRGKWTGATCHGERRWCGKLSPSGSFFDWTNFARLSNATVLLPNVGADFWQGLLPKLGIWCKGNTICCKGLILVFASKIFRIPLRRIP